MFLYWFKKVKVEFFTRQSSSYTFPKSNDSKYFGVKHKHDKLEPRFYCESGVERRIHDIFVGDYN